MAKAQIVLKVLSVLGFITIIGCGKSAELPSILIPNQSSGVPSGSPLSPTNPSVAGGICSALSFANVSYPSSLNSADDMVLSLALNITGSYEGNSSWGNLANNFDGQGMSLGLLNQNLGTGSLQPLLLSMNNKSGAIIRQDFAAADSESMQNMLSSYYGKTVNTLQALFALDDLNADVVNADPVSPFDKDIATITPKTISSESESVQWAITNLYLPNGSFVPQWQAELVKMANTPQYISVQVQGALGYHNKVLSYMNELSVHQVRAYLMLFDVVTQNGGLYAADITSYLTWLKSNPNSDETARLTKILNLRLTHVLVKYYADVLSRKLTIINGIGVVHETRRNLPSQYCYSSTANYR